MTDAIDRVIELRVGDRFVLRGRTFTLADYAGWSHYEGYSIVPVWNASGLSVKVQVRPHDRIEVLP